MNELRAPLQAQVVHWLVRAGDNKGAALNMAATLEIDAVIDPARTREWLVRGLASSPVKRDNRHRAIDTW